MTGHNANTNGIRECSDMKLAMHIAIGLKAQTGMDHTVWKSRLAGYAYEIRANNRLLPWDADKIYTTTD